MVSAECRVAARIGGGRRSAGLGGIGCGPRRPQNQQVKHFRSLLTKKRRQRAGLCPLEGVRLIESALDAGAHINTAFACPELLTDDRAQALIARIKALGAPVHALTLRAFESMCDTQNPQGIAATARVSTHQLEDRLVNHRHPGSGVRDPTIDWLHRCRVPYAALCCPASVRTPQPRRCVPAARLSPDRRRHLDDVAGTGWRLHRAAVPQTAASSPTTLTLWSLARKRMACRRHPWAVDRGFASRSQ